MRLIGAADFPSPADLERFDEQQRVAASVHHPNLVASYATGEWEGGRFVATRFIRGVTLATLLEEGVAPPAQSVEKIAGAVSAIHAASLVHGGISPHNVLVEANGTCYLADLGLARAGTAQADSDALAEVNAAVRSAEIPKRRIARGWLVVAAVASCAIAAAALIFALGGQEEPANDFSVPAPPPNTTFFGGSLDGAAEPLGCSAAPDANTPACTFAQTRLNGKSLAVPRSGVIRGWVVRGASGVLELQVVRERKGNSFVAGFSQPARVSGLDPRAFPAGIEVRPGDRIAVRLDPGASIGSRDPAAGAAIARWDGGLTADPRPSTEAIGDIELMLRADIEYGARATGPPQILGEQAARAPAGQTLTDAPVSLPVGGGVQVFVVAVGGGVAIDVFDERRLARVEVPDADPEGELLELNPNCGPAVPGGLCFRWRNPQSELPLDHQYVVHATGRVTQIG
jgi:hypothetical protein